MPDSEVTEIMRFTVLPYELVAKAWLDPSFCDALIAHPRPFLLDKSDKYTRFAQYIIVRDTPSVKHYILPHVAAGAHAAADLLAKLQDETGGEEDYSDFLPPAVTHRALTDDTFRRLFIRSPNAIVDQIGMPCPYPMRVIENSAGVYHIPLRLNPTQSVDYKAAVDHLKGAMIAAKSTKCCATGTCDCNDIHI